MTSARKRVLDYAVRVLVSPLAIKECECVLLRNIPAIVTVGLGQDGFQDSWPWGIPVLGTGKWLNYSFQPRLSLKRLFP